MNLGLLFSMMGKNSTSLRMNFMNFLHITAPLPTPWIRQSVPFVIG
jgi:hypothetical protein